MRLLLKIKFYLLISALFCTQHTLYAGNGNVHLKDENIYQQLSTKATLVQHFSGDLAPDSIVKLVNGTKYAVVIWNSYVQNNMGFFNAMLSVSIPSTDQKLIFMGEQITFSNSSGITGRARLRLMQDISVQKGEVINLTFKSNETYAEIDCNGFQLMSLHGEIELSRNYVLLEKPDGSISEARVKSNFTLATTDFSDFLLKISLPTFQIKGLKDFSFTVSNAYLDFSDYANPPSLFLDPAYDASYNTDSSSRLWQGLYLQQLKIKLPPFIQKSDDPSKKERLEYVADHLLIDDKGITGGFEAGNLLSLEKGNLGGWEFSLERMRVNLFKNELKQAFFSGKLALPITGKKDTLGYVCGIGKDDSYLFQVNVAQKTLSFPSIRATQASLYPNSLVQIAIENNKAKIRASLSGRLSIGANYGEDGTSDKLTLNNVQFEELEIANYEPIVALKAMEYTHVQENPTLSGFPITINSIGFRSLGNILQLKVNMSVNFTQKIPATGGIIISAAVDKSTERTKFTFRDVSMDALAVKVDVTKITLEGKVVFFKQEPIFGNGFKGELQMSVKMGSTIKVGAGALFGRKGTHRYWFADASVSGLHIPMFAGVITGFAGGAYQGMTKNNTTTHPLSQSLSGQRYLPDSSAGIGFQAGMTFGLPNPKTIFASVLLELAFNTDASLRRIFLLGEATVMDIQGTGGGGANQIIQNVNKLNALSNTSQGIGNDIPILKHFTNMDSRSVTSMFGGNRPAPPALKANIQLDFNFKNDEFFALFKAYINVAGGVVRGGYAEGLAGQGTMFMSKGKWNLKIGTPSNRIVVNVLGIASFSSYLMVGTEIEGSPAPPATISKMLGLNAWDLDYMRDENALGTGRGFAFGADFNLQSGDRKFLLFYYRVAGGAGFDVMIKNYGANAYCEGRHGPVGINGWYANGQAYVYFQGSIGMDVKLAFIKGRYEILRVGAAAILQAKLPNPTWVKGIIGGDYSILNGLVSGHCRIEAEFGDQCVLKRFGNELAAIDVISSLTPENNKSDVSVFAKPQVVFNIPINQPFEFTDEIDPNTTKIFRARLAAFWVKDKSGATIEGEQEWNRDNTIVAFSSKEILPPQKQLISSAHIVFEQFQNGNWNLYRNDNGQPEIESRIVTFTTGIAPDNIPLENIAYTYPVIGQKNFFKNYSNVGYIQLKHGQEYLFAGTDHVLQSRFEIQGSKKQLVAATYNAGKKRIEFKIPDLPANTIFDYAVVQTPKDNNASLSRNVEAKSQTVLTASGDNNSTASVTTQEASGELVKVEDKVLLSYNFRTSHYPDLEAKLKEIKGFRNYMRMFSLQASTVSAEYSLPKEPFDASEIEGAEGMAPTVIFDMDIQNTPWFRERFQPLIYKEYPLFGTFTLRRDTSVYGLVPTRNFSLEQDNGVKNLSDAEVGSGKLSTGATAVTLTAHFHVAMYQDFLELRNKVAQASVRWNKPIYQKLLSSNFPGISNYRGDIYPIDIFYCLPGSKNKIKVITQQIVIK